MQYLLLIYGNEVDEVEKVTPEVMQAFGALTQKMKDSGNYVGGSQLKPVASATSVRIRDGQTLVTDGPFAETREQLGGFYVIEAGHLDEAIALAAQVPSAKFGTIEVRPVWQH